MPVPGDRQRCGTYDSVHLLCRVQVYEDRLVEDGVAALGRVDVLELYECRAQRQYRVVRQEMIRHLVLDQMQGVVKFRHGQHDERHRNDGVAAVHGLEGGALGPCPGESDAVPNVGEFYGTDGVRVRNGVGRVNQQRHRHHGVATIDSLEGGTLGAGPGKGDAVPTVGELTGTDDSGVGDGIERLDHQRHRHHGVAAVDTLEDNALGARLRESDPVPSVGEFVSANGSGVGDGVERVYNQRHRNHGVAAIHSREGDTLGAGLGKGDPVPDVGELVSADDSGVIDGVGRVDNQHHRDHRVAAVHGLEGGALGPCPGEDDAVPSVGELVGTDDSGVGDGVGRVDHQRHGHHGVAAMDGREGGVLVARLREGDPVPGVGEFVSADDSGVGDGIERLDHQHHRNYGVAAADTLEGGAMGARLREGNTVPAVGELVSADGHGVIDGVGRVDNQGHRNDGVAAIHALESGALGARFREGDPVPGMGELIGANDGGVGDGIERFDHQCHGNDRVAAADGRQGGALSTRLGESDTVPGVGELVGADGLSVGDGVCRDYSQSHRDDGVAAVHALEGGALRARLREGDTVPDVGKRILADGGGVGDGIERFDNQRHRDHGVAVVHGRESDILGTRLCESDTVPSIGEFVSADSCGVGDGVGRADVQSHRHGAVHPVGGCKHGGLCYDGNA